MTPLERLFAEELPTGTFGCAPSTRRPEQPRPRPAVEPPPPREAPEPDPLAEWHCAELLADLDRPRTRRHLRAVAQPAA